MIPGIYRHWKGDLYLAVGRVSLLSDPWVETDWKPRSRSFATARLSEDREVAVEVFLYGESLWGRCSKEHRGVFVLYFSLSKKEWWLRPEEMFDGDVSASSGSIRVEGEYGDRPLKRFTLLRGLS